MSRRLLLLLSSFAVLALLSSCGKGAASSAEAKAAIDADPLALLPGSAIIFANVDAHAMFASGSVGGTVVSLADSHVPLGDDTGFVASRDVDRITLGSYAVNEADVAVVLSGRFDVDKIAATTKTKTGTPTVRGTYAGFATLAAGATTIVPLTPRTLVAGTLTRVHAVLDRIQQGTLTRSAPPWVGATLDSQGAQFAVAADLSNQVPLPTTIGAINLTFLKDLRVVRVIGDFNPPGVNAAATLSYATDSQAQAAADGMRLIGSWQTLLAPILFGAKLQNLQIRATGSDVSCKFAVDDQSLRGLVALAERYLHPPSP